MVVTHFQNVMVEAVSDEVTFVAVPSARRQEGQKQAPMGNMDWILKQLSLPLIAKRTQSTIALSSLQACNPRTLRSKVIRKVPVACSS